MTGADAPREVVLAHLTRVVEASRAGDGPTDAWAAVAVASGQVPARLETLRFVRERFADGAGVLAVEYDDVTGRGWSMLFGVVRGEGGAWRMSGAGGGSRSELSVSAPWAHLGVWWDARTLHAGGRVYGDEVRCVRMVAADAAGTLLRSHPHRGGRPR